MYSKLTSSLKNNNIKYLNCSRQQWKLKHKRQHCWWQLSWSARRTVGPATRRALTIVTPNYTREGGGSRIALFPDHRAFVPCTRACPGSGWRGVPAELVKGQHKPCHSEFPTFYPLLQLEMCCGYKTGCIQCDYSVSSNDRAPRWLSRCVVSAPVSMCVSLFLCHSVCDRYLHGYYFTFSSTD